MRLVVCLIDPERQAIPEAVRQPYESPLRSLGLTSEWQSIGQVAVLSSGDKAGGGPLVIGDAAMLAVGMVRLDNRSEVERWAESKGGQLTDLELVLRTVARHGTKYVPELLGDFAFVVWNAVTKTVVAACDAFRVKKLYYTERNGLFAFATRAEALAVQERYDIQFLAEWVAGCPPSPGVSVYEKVKAVPAGAMVLIARGSLTVHQYWAADDVQRKPMRRMAAREAAELLRTLLIEAVRLRLGSNGDTWAQLSGGVDSSSVVSITQWLVERGAVTHGLGGTVTYVDRQGTGADERQYSNAVVGKWRLRNETIIDPPLWYDERYPAPRADQPRLDLMFYPREQRLCEIVSAAGGRVLLTGQGSDEFLRGNMFFFADWLARGKLRSAVREMARRAAIGRVSFWELAYRNAITPLLPPAVRRWLGPEVTRLPPWVLPAITRRYELRERTFEMTLYAGCIGHKYHHAVATCLGAVGRTIGYLVLEDTLDVRHPFLYRPLVEFGLRLPPELVVRPYARKWVLREAMRGILPERVRTRVGKGTTNERYAWSLAEQRSLLKPLVQEPMLADLGVVDAVQIRMAFDAAPRQPGQRGDPHGSLQGVLAIEAWLQMRTGRWPHGGCLNQ